VKVKLEGFKELDAALGELTKAAARGVLRRAGVKALEPIAVAASAMAPVESGKLQTSVGVGTKLTKRQSILHRKSVKDDKSSVEVFAGAGGLAQATQQEFGNFKDPAQPFLRPAWDAGKGRVLDDLKTELAAEIGKAAKRAAAKAARLAKAAGG
jgi:HK97 gp10 family phage protein